MLVQHTAHRPCLKEDDTQKNHCSDNFSGIAQRYDCSRLTEILRLFALNLNESSIFTHFLNMAHSIGEKCETAEFATSREVALLILIPEVVPDTVFIAVHLNFFTFIRDFHGKVPYVEIGLTCRFWFISRAEE